MRDERCVRISRDIFSHGIARQNLPWDRLSAWIYILVSASVHGETVMHRGRSYHLARGQLLLSDTHMERKTGWGRQAVRSFMRYLRKENMITTVTDSLCTVVTICNYSKWQSSSVVADATAKPNQVPNQVQPAPQQPVCPMPNQVPNQVNQVHTSPEAAADGVPNQVPALLYSLSLDTTEKEELKTKDSFVKKKSLLTICFDYSGGVWQNIDDRHRELWRVAFPNVNIDRELAAAATYLLDNPKKRYTNYGAFLRNWLARSKGMCDMSEIGKRNIEEWNG